MTEFWALGFGGFLGATARYYLVHFTNRLLGSGFPYGTLAVNILGCFLLGFIATAVEDKFSISPVVRTFLTVGILGAFTTFSTFSYETIALVRAGNVAVAFANIFLSLAVGILAAYVGISVSKMI